MAVINIKKLAREYFQRNILGINQDIGDKDITVIGTIRMPENSIQLWKTSAQNDSKTFQKKVNIVNHKRSALAQIIVPASDNVTRVLLEKGIVKGLQGNQTVTLPLWKTGLDGVFGDRFNIDPSLPAQEDRRFEENPNSDQVLSEECIVRGNYSPVVEYKRMESEWAFHCPNATLKGKALIRKGRCVTERDIAEIVQELKLNATTDEFDDIQVERKEVRFTISGEILFRWDCQHRVLW